jgi:hypothetical protein
MIPGDRSLPAVGCKITPGLLKNTLEKARKYHPVREQLCSLSGVKIRMTPPEIPLEATPVVCF